MESVWHGVAIVTFCCAVLPFQRRRKITSTPSEGAAYFGLIVSSTKTDSNLCLGGIICTNLRSMRLYVFRMNQCATAPVLSLQLKNYERNSWEKEVKYLKPIKYLPESKTIFLARFFLQSRSLISRFWRCRMCCMTFRYVQRTVMRKCVNENRMYQFAVIMERRTLSPSPKMWSSSSHKISLDGLVARF